MCNLVSAISALQMSMRLERARSCFILTCCDHHCRIKFDDASYISALSVSAGGGRELAVLMNPAN